MTHSAYRGFALLVLIVSGCGRLGFASHDRADPMPLDGRGSLEAGPGDAGPADAMTVDAAQSDTGPIDPGSIDAGPMDGSAVDAGAMDTGIGIVDAGTVALGAPIRVTNATGTASNPSLVWTGGGFGVAWYDTRDGGTEIYFAVLDENGDRVGSPTRVSNAAGGSFGPSLAWTGSEFGVAWHDDRDGDVEIYFARLDAAGTRVGPEVRVSNALGRSLDVSLVWTGTDYAMAWEDEREATDQVYFARLSATGAKLTGDVRVSADPEGRHDPILLWTGSELVAVWQDFRVSSSEIFFARLDNTGTVRGAEVRVTDAPMPSRQPFVVATDVGFAVAFSDDRTGVADIYVSDLDGSGVPVDIRRVSNDPNTAGRPALAWTPSGLGVVWDGNVSTTGSLYFTVIDPSGIVGDRILISNGVDEASDPSIVWTGSAFAIAWEDARGGSDEVYFRLLAY